MAPAVASAQEKSVWAPQALATAYAAQEDTRAEALEATSAQPTSMRGQERKDTMPDTLPPRAQDKGVASDRTGLPSVMSQDTRTIKGRRDQKEEPTATRKVTPGPQSKARTTRRTPVPESQAKALTTPGAGPMGRTRKGATTAAAPHRDTARATPPSTSSQGRTTRRSPSLRAANFKSEPRWDFEEQYSFDTEALQPVSLATASPLRSPCGQPTPLPPPSRLRPTLPCLHPNLLSLSGQSRRKRQVPDPGLGSGGRCEGDVRCPGAPRRPGRSWGRGRDTCAGAGRPNIHPLAGGGGQGLKDGKEGQGHQPGPPALMHKPDSWECLIFPARTMPPPSLPAPP